MPELEPLIFPLDVSPAGENAHRDAWIVDALRFGIVCNDEKMPGIYFQNGQLVERKWTPKGTASPATNPAPQLQPTAVPLAPEPVHASIISSRGLPPQVAVLSSHVQLPVVPQTNMLPSIGDAQWHLTVENVSAFQGQFYAQGQFLIVHAEIQVASGPDTGVWIPMMTPGDWAGPVRYRFVVDTGAGVNSWVFRDTQDPQLTAPAQVHVPSPELAKKMWERKRKVVCADDWVQPYDRTTLYFGLQGDMKIEVFQVMTSLKVLQGRTGVELDRFPLGLTDKFDCRFLTLPFDGLLAMGPCLHTKFDAFRSAPRVGESKGFMQALISDGRIERPIAFFVVRHKIWESENPKIYNMMSLGGWKTDHNMQDNHHDFVVVPVDDSVNMQVWNLHLHSISLGNPNRRITINVNKSVRIDTGASQSYLPQESCTTLYRILYERFGAPGGVESGYAPTNFSDDWVTFVFTRGEKKYSVGGQMSRFFVSPSRWNGFHTCCVGVNERNAILGQNFFRTFIVGMEDGMPPTIHLARQRWIVRPVLP